MNRENRKEEQFYIDRTGRTHKYKGNLKDGDVVSYHYEIAHKLYPGLRNPDDKLMELGWVLVGSSVYTHPIIHIKPTQAQVNRLDIMGEYERLTFLHKGYYANYDKYQLLCP